MGIRRAVGRLVVFVLLAVVTAGFACVFSSCNLLESVFSGQEGVDSRSDGGHDYAALLGSVDGTAPLLSRAMLDRATTLTRAADDPVPLVPGTWELFGLGYVLSGPKNELGRIFGHGGYGGSEGIADRKTRLAVGYTSNSLHANPRTRNRIYELLDLHSRDW